MLYNRRLFLLAATTTACELLLNRNANAKTGDSTGFDIQYSEDTTAIVGVKSPYSQCDAFNLGKLKAAIDEAFEAGVKKYVLQPGTGWVPWWKSSFYSAQEHYAWFEKTYGDVAPPLSSFAAYMIQGGDILGDALAHCKLRGLPMYVSIRLNDAHGIEFSGNVTGATSAIRNALGSAKFEAPARQARSLEFIPRVHWEHPEWQIDPAGRRAEDHVWNWGLQGPVEWRKRQISELCYNYNFDGLQLDFMRFPRFFSIDIGSAERVNIMTRFVEYISHQLNLGSVKRRPLSLRVPVDLAERESLGLDIGKLISAGADEIVVSGSVVTTQELDWDYWGSFSKKVNLLIEITDDVSNSPVSQGGNSLDSKIHATSSQILTTAWLAKQYGFCGVSLFNFDYFRQVCNSQSTARAQEPPFYIIAEIAKLDPPRQQSFFLGSIEKLHLPGAQLPVRLAPGSATNVRLYVNNFSMDWYGDVWILLALADWRNPSTRNAGASLSLNGLKAESIPVPLNWNPIAALSDKAFAFRLPSQALRIGENMVSVRAENAFMQVSYLEIAISAH